MAKAKATKLKLDRYGLGQCAGLGCGFGCPGCGSWSAGQVYDDGIYE